MAIKNLYISDLDGTLLNSNKEVSNYTRDTINTLIDNGVHFSVATARSAATALKILSNVNINLPVVFMNGVVIYDMALKKYIKTEVIPVETANSIIDIIKECEITGFMYAISNDELITYYENLCTKPLKDFHDERVTKYCKSFEKVDSFLDRKMGDKIIYFTFMDEFQRLSTILNEFRNHQDIDAVLYKDVYAEDLWFLEIHSKNASKHNAVKYLREYLGYDRIIGFGDNLNDIPLFEACDEGFAVANAVDELKEKAARVIDSNNSDGVARFIYERESNKGSTKQK